MGTRKRTVKVTLNLKARTLTSASIFTNRKMGTRTRSGTSLVRA